MLMGLPQFSVVIPRSTFLPLNVMKSQLWVKADEVVAPKGIARMALQQSCEAEAESNAVVGPRNAVNLRIMKTDEFKMLRRAFHLFSWPTSNFSGSVYAVRWKFLLCAGRARLLAGALRERTKFQPCVKHKGELGANQQ